MACTVEPICKLQKELANFDDITTTFMNKHSSLNMSQSPLRFQSLADVKNRLLNEKHASMKPFRPKKLLPNSWMEARDLTLEPKTSWPWWLYAQCWMYIVHMCQYCLNRIFLIIKMVQKKGEHFGKKRKLKIIVNFRNNKEKEGLITFLCQYRTLFTNS